MKNDFKSVVDHRFSLRGDWGSRPLSRRSSRSLSWHVRHCWRGRRPWTLTPTSTGTHLRMEQSGFRPDQQQAYNGVLARQKFLASLEEVLARIE